MASHDTLSTSQQSRLTAMDRHARTAAAGAILLLALAVRVVYAYGLPLNGDEGDHLREARRISLRSDDFYLPLDSPVSNHPLGVLYMTAAADWAGGGSLLAVRLAFVGLSMAGLVGLYVLTDSLFGAKAALVALALAAVDRHLVASAGVFLESPAVISLAPWAILLMHRCVRRGALGDWLLAGLVFALGYWISTVFLVLLLPFGLYILASGRLLDVLRSPQMYAGLALMLVLMSPPLVADLLTGGPNYDRNVSKVGQMGVSPRGLLLYLGDLMILVKDPFWIVENIGLGMYGPMYVPCNWVMGLVYLGGTAAAVRFWRDERVRLLLSVIAGVLIPVSLLDAREPWNEFTWASATLFAAIPATAMIIERMAVGRRGRVAAWGVLLYAAASTLLFLAGPKWGYFCPEYERAYIGRHAAVEFRSNWNPETYPPHEAEATKRSLAREIVAAYPDSAVAWFFLGRHARTAAEQKQAFERVLELDPDNRLVLESKAANLKTVGDWPAAKELLERLLARGGASVRVSMMLSEVEYRLGNYEAAAAHARRAVGMKPEDSQPYRALYLACDALGEESEAKAALGMYADKNVAGRAAARLDLAEEFFDQGKSEKGREFLEAAVEEGLQGVNDHMVAGTLFLTRLQDAERAIAEIRAAVRLQPSDPNAHYNLGYALETAGDDLAAVESYQEALSLSPGHARARARLEALLQKLGQGGEPQ